MILPLIFFILIFYFVLTSLIKNSSSAYTLLYDIFVMQQFSNISTVYSSSSLAIIRADNSGENYVFGVKKDLNPFSVQDIEKIYTIAQGLHIHTIVIASNTPITTTNSIYRRIREYNIEVWDIQKLRALSSEISSANSSHTYSVLRTSDTSDDTCKIDTNSYDPIQEESLKPHSLFSGLFDKPDRL